MTTDYRKSIFESLANFGYNKGQVDYILGSLDAAIQGGATTEKVFNRLLSEFDGNANTAVASYESNAGTIRYMPSSKTAQTIQEDLSHLPKLTIQSPQERIANIVKRYNASLHKCAATLKSAFTGGQEVSILNDDEISTLELAAPRKQSTDKALYESWATFRESIR